MRHRWQAFENLLEGKRLRLQAQASEPVAKLRQQDPVLDCIRAAPQGRIRQQDLAQQLQLTKGRISQILGVLEDRGHITRQRQGRESWVSLLTSHSTPAATTAPPAPLAPTTPAGHLGARVFGLHQEAA
jgi:DNA-binding MarR family transcriptional regulator